MSRITREGLGKIETMIYWALANPAWDETCPPDDFLSLEEKKRLSEFRFIKRRTDWLRGRWAAKQLLLKSDTGCSHLSIQDIRVANEPEGAPYFLFNNGRRYSGNLSISHCGPYAFCALSDKRIGCDLEVIEPRPAEFIEDFFTQAEAKCVHEWPEKRQSVIVNLIWSMKEAVLKSMGKGLRLDTRVVEIDSLQTSIFDQMDDSKWKSLPVHSPVVDSLISAWWKRKDNYVMTLAVIPESETILDRDIKEIYLMSDQDNGANGM